MQALLLGNEDNRRAKLLAKEREMAEQLDYQRQYAEMLDRQEEVRAKFITSFAGGHPFLQ